MSVVPTCERTDTAHPSEAIVVNTTTFNGSSFNLITDDSGNRRLSLLATNGLSYFTVSSNMASGVGDYASYRFATKNEVLALFIDYGAPNIDAGQTVANLPAAQAFETDFGPTGGNPFETQTLGIYIRYPARLSEHSRIPARRHRCSQFALTHNGLRSGQSGQRNYSGFLKGQIFGIPCQQRGRSYVFFGTGAHNRLISAKGHLHRSDRHGYAAFKAQLSEHPISAVHKNPFEISIHASYSAV